MEFEKAGTTMSDKTETGRVKAIKHLDLFLALKQLGTLNELIGAYKESILCDKELYQEFGTYLIYTATSLMNNDKINDGNALGILSHITKLSSTKFPNNSTWISSPFNTWYSTLRDDTRKTILRRNLKEGIKASPGDEKHPIGRELLSEMGEGLLELGTVESEKQRCAMNMSFAAIGRSGEVSISL